MPTETTLCRDIAVGERRGGNRCGPTRVPDNVDPAIAAVFQILSARGATIAEASRLSGVAERTIRGWRINTPPLFPNLQAVLNTYGYELVAVRKGSIAKSPAS